MNIKHLDDPYIDSHKTNLKEILLFYSFPNGNTGALGLGHTLHLKYCMLMSETFTTIF